MTDIARDVTCILGGFQDRMEVLRSFFNHRDQSLGRLTRVYPPLNKTASALGDQHSKRDHLCFIQLPLALVPCMRSWSRHKDDTHLLGLVCMVNINTPNRYSQQLRDICPDPERWKETINKYQIHPTCLHLDRDSCRVLEALSSLTSSTTTLTIEACTTTRSTSYLVLLHHHLSLRRL